MFVRVVDGLFLLWLLLLLMEEDCVFGLPFYSSNLCHAQILHSLIYFTQLVGISVTGRILRLKLFIPNKDLFVLIIMLTARGRIRSW